MKTILYISLLLLLLGIFACSEPYDPNVGSKQKILVVDGFLGNLAGSNYIALSLASSYDRMGKLSPISKAEVFITDNTQSVFKYKEYSSGYYKPVDTSFAGSVNKSYTLTVKTSDGTLYHSNPEVMMPALAPAHVYGGYNKEDQLVKYIDGTTIKTEKDVCEIYCDYESTDQVTPRFRFTSSHLIEYIINKNTGPPAGGPIFYCWSIGDDNSLRFTDEKYSANSSKVTKQTVSVIAAERTILVPDMDIKTLDYKDTTIQMMEYKRFIGIHQYRLNPDSYTWYKGVESQAAAEGKMFDPITTQLKGNMNCISDPAKIVFGFFEVSSVATHTYNIKREVIGGPVGVTEISVNFPKSNGFTVDKVPNFWIW